MCMNDSTNRCVVVSNKFLACIYVQLRASRGEKRFFDIFRDCALMGYKLHLVYVIRFIESHYLRLTCNIYIGRIMHSCTLLGVCRVTCNRLYRYVSRRRAGLSQVLFLL